MFIFILINFILLSCYYIDSDTKYFSILVSFAVVFYNMLVGSQKRFSLVCVVLLLSDFLSGSVVGLSPILYIVSESLLEKLGIRKINPSQERKKSLKEVFFYSVRFYMVFFILNKILTRLI